MNRLLLKGKNTLNMLGKEILNKFIWSRDNTRFLIEIFSSYKYWL